jgi:hypothetical protein
MLVHVRIAVPKKCLFGSSEFWNQHTIFSDQRTALIAPKSKQRQLSSNYRMARADSTAAVDSFLMRMARGCSVTKQNASASH